MAKTFEEVVGAELDGLWAGALFLNAGAHEAARRLLEDALARASAVFVCRPSGTPVDVWLEDRLVRTYLAGDSGLGDSPAPPRDAHPEPLFAAAAVLTRRARAALWLVLLRRRGYADAQDVLGVERDELTALLGAQEALHRAYRRASGPGGPEMDRVGAP